jgi:hypothetical protein
VRFRVKLFSPAIFIMYMLSEVTSSFALSLIFKIPPVLSKLKHIILHSQTREVVWNVLKFMEQEEQGSFTIPISKAQKRTEAATGVTVRTV